MELSSIQDLLTILGTLFGGGLIGSIVGIRYRSSVEKSKAEQEKARARQENETAESQDISNTEKLINIYKKALTDMEELQAKSKKEQNEQINKLKDEIKELNEKLKDLSKSLSESQQTIAQQQKIQLKLKLELQQLYAQRDNDCSSCAFKETCEKYKAKQILNEQANDSDLLSNE